jgi:hypothetical protein
MVRGPKRGVLTFAAISGSMCLAPLTAHPAETPGAQATQSKGNGGVSLQEIVMQNSDAKLTPSQIDRGFS